MFMSLLSVASLFLISGACHIALCIFVVSLRFRAVLSFLFVPSISFLLSLSAFPPFSPLPCLPSFVVFHLFHFFFSIFSSSLLFHGPR